MKTCLFSFKIESSYIEKNPLQGKLKITIPRD